MRDFSQRIAGLSPQQRALLVQRLKKKAAEVDEDNIARLPRAAEDTAFALSFAQQRLWFLDQLEPGIAYYNISMSWRLTGALDVSALQRSFNDIVARHETLRTSFATANEQPIQIIHKTQALPLTVVDLRGQPVESRETDARRFATEAGNGPFDLSCSPLIRVCLVRVADREHLLSVTMHHIVSDGWSMEVLFRELIQLYEAHIAGRASPLGELPIQYADYAEWQRQRLLGETLTGDIAFWKQQLAGAPPLIDLPLDRPRPAHKTYRGARVSRVFSKDLSDSLKALSQSESATLFMTLLAGFKLLLWRYSRSDDIVVGSPVANRDRTEIEGLIGFFVSTLVLRTDLSGDPTFRELLARVREVSLAAHAHQQLPFEKLVEVLRPQRSASYSPLFQVMFALQNANPQMLTLTGLTVEPLETQRETAKFDLSIVCDEDSQGLKVLAIYNTDLFDAGSIERLLAHFQALLAQIVTDPGQRIALLLPLPQTERRRIANKRLIEVAGSVPVEEGCAPLSAAQTRLWILHRLDPHSTAFNRPVAVRLGGRLDPDCLAKSINAIIERHEALRTVFLERDGQPLQRVLPVEPIALQLQDLTGLGAETRERAALNIAAEAAQQTFDLSLGPMVRAVLLRLGECEHVLLLLMHHIVIDGWSEGVLLHELAVLYEAFLQGRPSLLPQLPIQYADFAIAQREHLAGTALQRQLAYWQLQLEQLPVLELSTDYPRPDVASNRAATVNLILPAALVERLEALCRRQGATLFMGLLAIFEVLLVRYSRQDDFAVGVPIAGRATVESESLIGCFMNVLVLRADISGDPSFRELLARVHDTALDAYANQEMPFEKLVEALRPERVTNHWPLFQTMLQLRNLPNFEAAGAGALKITSFKFDSGSIGGLDLSVEVVKVAGELHCAFIYARELFRGDTVVRMVQHFRALAQACADEPDRLPGELPILSEEEHRALIEWNATQTDYPREHCVHQLFETMVEQTPDAIALVFGAGQLSYRELNSRANSLAHYLRKLGVGANVIVGLCVPRSIEMIVGVLGILKAGGAYLPLDPVYPKARLAFMLDDAQAPILLTLANPADVLPSHTARRICLDTDWPMIAQECVNNLICETNPRNPAYVIYTSGSTGTPKGVVVEHGSLVNYSASAVADYALHAGDRVLQFASVNFDASAEEIYPCLIRGATLVLRNDEMLSSAAQFLRTCADWKVSVLSLPTAWWHDIAASVIPEELAIPPSLRFVIIGGEAAVAGRLASWQQWTGSRVELINTYGPTEATVVATRWKAPQAINDLAAVPIGRPIANTQIYILDPHLNSVPIGVPGELCIGGAGLARGYLNRPELTAEKFIANPFGAGLLYKTGDLARYLPDGNIEFLGRIDTQVKVRGFRIELGEIETALNQHPGVKVCAVLAREDAPGDKRLVAYVVGHKAPAPGELRDFLREKLPEYMLPTSFIMLDHLPLTANGKLDRKALPAPEDSRPDLDALYVAPRTPTEETLAAIWAEVLKLDQVGIHDNFFDLGGHSLLAAQLISRVREQLDIDLPLRAIFEAPTVESLAAQIASAKASSKRAIAHNRKRDSAPVSIAQARLLFLDQLQPNSSVYNVPAGFWIEGSLDVRALAEGLGEIVRRHEALRTSFANAGDEPVQVIQAPRKFELPVIDLMDLPAASRRAEALRLSREDARAPFDLASGPLLRAKLVRLTDREYLFILNVHHIVFDGWSRGVLYRELSGLYRAYRSSKPSPLLELPIQYADFAVWQRCVLGGNTLDEHLAYWKRQLGGALPVLELPLDRPRPAVQDHDGACELMTMPESLTDALRSLKNRKRVTLFTLLLAAFQLLLYRLSGQDDIVLGVPVAGRNRIDTEALIGFFISTVAIRADLSGNPSFSEYLDRVRKITLDAYDHQDVPFERLVEELRPARSTARNPIFDVLINFISNRQVALPQLDDLVTGSLETHQTESKFSMTLYIRDEGATLKLALAYQTALFSSERMACMLNQYRCLLEQICADPARPLLAYSLVDPASRVLLPDPSVQIHEPLHGLTADAIADWAQRTPAKNALYHDGKALSYCELWHAAQAIASEMHAHGLKRSDVVAISGPKSFGLIACMVAALLSGGVMLTLDRRFPGERQRLLVRATGAKQILYIGDFKPEDAWIRELDAATIIEIDAGSALPVHPLAPIDRGASSVPKIAPDDPAYIFFTSGTTGVPKGTLGSHKSLSHFLAWQRETFAIGPDDRVAQLTALSFDVLLRDVFLPLTGGASLHLPDEAEGLAPGYILPWLARERISVLHTVPALAQSWLADVPHDLSLSDLRWVFFSGERLQDTLIKRWRSATSHTGAIVNLYGPTETTMAKCFHRVIDEEPLGVQPVGRPLPQTQVLVMSASNQRCGIGEPGEIAIRTPFRTLGYINAPDEQRNRFVKNRFRDDEQDLLYLTGDRGRYRPDGTLMMEGRLDDQVKINGVRVEPGEAGAILAQHEALEACFVMARKDDGGENFLAAYVVVKREVNASELRTFLSSKLPAPAVPSAFVFLDSLPLTANGKLDRKALPAPDNTRSIESFVAPRTANEETLAAIWAEVLQLDRIGIHDNFFDLGGHSLLATQVVSRVTKTFELDIPLRALFESPTVAGLSALILQKQAHAFSDDELAQMLTEAQNQGSRGSE